MGDFLHQNEYDDDPCACGMACGMEMSLGRWNVTKMRLVTL